MKLIALILAAFLLTGCSTVGWILDILAPTKPEKVPVPVCDKVAYEKGLRWDGKQCLLYSDGMYRWELK